MTIYNLGSINIDHSYFVKKLPLAGETITALDYKTGLGGKGANQSIAIARAGGAVQHIGAIHEKDDWIYKQLAQDDIGLYALDRQDEAVTGHAIIAVEIESGMNQIMLHPAANQRLNVKELFARALKSHDMSIQDWALTQNETNGIEEFFIMARERGMKLCYSPAPFVANVVENIIENPMTCPDMIVLNEGEAQALFDQLHIKLSSNLTQAPLISSCPVEHLIITMGENGLFYYKKGQDKPDVYPAYKVKAIDTTAAGDCFLGYLLAQISMTHPKNMAKDMAKAIEFAMAASALSVMRQGASDSIPHQADVKNFLKAKG